MCIIMHIGILKIWVACDQCYKSRITVLGNNKVMVSRIIYND